eukprot:8978088-Pyramimonas_sp.AAC.1
MILSEGLTAPRAGATVSPPMPPTHHDSLSAWGVICQAALKTNGSPVRLICLPISHSMLQLRSLKLSVVEVEGADEHATFRPVRQVKEAGTTI